MKFKSIAPLTFALLLVAPAGCATSGLLKTSKSDVPKSGPKNPVIRILGVWEPAMGPGLEEKTTRGCLGQIYFFSQGSDLAAMVDGDVRVYVFDDEGSAEEQTKPLHEVNFPAASWNALLTKGPLGATYNVFIPYIRPGNHEAKCSLRIRYKPANGPIAYSDFVNICLEGKKKPGAKHESDETAAHLKARAHSSGALPHQVADAAGAGPADGPPRARGLAEAITASLGPDVLQPRRPSAVALTDQERERIVREFRARMKAENKGDIAPAAYDDSDGESAPAARKPTRRRSANPLQEEVDVADDDRLDATSEENSDQSSPPVRRHRTLIRRHILADVAGTDDDGESSATSDPDDGAEHPAHLLDDAQ